MPYIPSLADIRGKADVAPNWRWVVRMPDLVPRVSLPSFPAPYQGLMRTSTIPFGLVDQIDFSIRTIDVDQRFAAGARVNYPRFMSVPNISVTFYEDVNYNVTKFLRSWMNLVIDENHNYGIPAVYKHPITLFAFDYVSNTAPVMVGYALGCFPTTFSGMSYAYDSSGPVTITADFAVDEDVIQVGAGSSLAVRLNGDESPLGQFRNFVQQVRGVADGIRGTIDNIMAPVREVRALADEAVGAGRDLVSQVRTIRDFPRNIRTEVAGVTGGFRGIGADFRSLGRSGRG